jgi:hypothetical protein
MYLHTYRDSVPGVFKKYITVFTTGKDEFIKLTIHGEVVL